MDNTADTAQVITRPPLAWGLAVIGGLALNWLVPLPFLPVDLPAGWLGAMVFVLALALFAWAIVTIAGAGSNVPANRPTTTIVESGPYRFTRNPIYLGMFLGLIGMAIAFAGIYQFIIVAMILAASGITGLLAILLMRRRAFSPAAQLILRREVPSQTVSAKA